MIEDDRWHGPIGPCIFRVWHGRPSPVRPCPFLPVGASKGYTKSMDNPDAKQIPPSPDGTDAKPLLEVNDLRVHFHLRQGLARAVDGVSFGMWRGRTLGMVGESGCGKSVTALSILRLIPSPPGKIETGSIHFDSRDLLSLSEEEMQHVRGNRISMIFQEPMTSLNPLHKVGSQIAEVLRLHRGLSKKDSWDRAVHLLNQVKIPSPAQRANDYPHQMSGGMRQRAVIAMALACSPDLIIADEPTTALDVTVQAQILDLMREIQESTGTAILLITHDLGVVAEVAHDVVVMYAGNIVESGRKEDILYSFAHPYTEGLLHSIPKVSDIQSGAELTPIQGTVPNPSNWPQGCKFHPRCPYMKPPCLEALPPLIEFSPGHYSRCIYTHEIFGDRTHE